MHLTQDMTLNLNFVTFPLISQQLCFLASSLSGQIVRHCQAIHREAFEKLIIHSRAPSVPPAFKSCPLPSSQRMPSPKVTQGTLSHYEMVD